MQITVEQEENSQRVYSVQIPEDAVNELFAKAFRAVVQDVQIPGFRKGKVPRKVFEKRYGTDSLREEALKEAFTLAYEEVLRGQDIRPLTYPRFEVVEFSEHKPATVKLTVALKPEFTLATYVNIKVKGQKIEVTDEEVDEQVKRLQLQQAEFVPLLENRPAQEGDWLALEVTPFDLRQNRQGKQAQAIWYKLGSEQLPPEFHMQLMGVNVGEKRTVDTTAPADASAQESPEAKLSVQVEVKDIRKETLPELDAQFAEKFQSSSMEELKQKVREELERVRQRREEQRIRAELVGKITKNAKIDVPDMLIEEALAEKLHRLEEELQKQNRSMASYLEEIKSDEKKLEKTLRTQAEMELKTLFVLDKIAEEEKILVTQEEVDERLELMVQEPDKKVKAQRLKEELHRKNQLPGFMQRIRNEKTMDFLYSKADISGGSAQGAK
jgi:trigger factor